MLGTWHHIAVTFSIAMAQSLLLVDGVAKSTVVTGTFPVDPVSTRVGCSGDDQNYLIGAVDDVLFYNHALSITDLKTLASAH